MVRDKTNDTWNDTSVLKTETQIFIIIIHSSPSSAPPSAASLALWWLRQMQLRRMLSFEVDFAILRNQVTDSELDAFCFCFDLVNPGLFWCCLLPLSNLVVSVVGASAGASIFITWPNHLI